MGILAAQVRGRLSRAAPLPVLAVQFLQQTAFVLLFVFLTQRYLADDRGLGVAFAGYVITIFGLTKLLTQAPAGSLGDRIGYKRALILGLTLSLAAAALMMSLREAWVFLAATALYSLGQAPVVPALNATVANLYDEEARGKVVALMNACSLAAFAVAGLGGLLVLDLLPPHAFFALAVGLSAAPIVVASLWLRETAAIAASGQRARRTAPFAETLLKPEVMTWAAIVLMVGLGMGLAAPVARPYVRDVLHMEMRELVPYLALPALLAAVSILPAGHLADRLGRVRPLAVGLGLGAIGMLGVSLTDSVWAMMGLATLIMMSYTVAAPAMGAALMDVTQEETRGLVLGALSTAGGLGGALGPTIGGSIYAALTPQDVFFTAGSLLAGAMMLTMVYGGWRFLAYRPVPVPIED